jgi:hypothetical protein
MVNDVHQDEVKHKVVPVANVLEPMIAIESLKK